MHVNGKRREKVTKLSWEERELASRSCSLQQPGSFKASTYHKNRKSTEGEGILPQRLRPGEIHREAPGRAGAAASKLTEGEKPPHTSAFQPPLGPAYSCVCGGNPGKSGAGLPRAPAWKQLVDFSGRPASRPALASPGAGAAGREAAPGWGQGGEARSLSGVEGTACENISIPHRLLPATNQPSQGAVSV